MEIIHFNYKDQECEYLIKDIFLTDQEPTNIVNNKKFDIENISVSPLLIQQPSYLAVIFENKNNDIFLENIKNAYIEGDYKTKYYIKPRISDIFILKDNMILFRINEIRMEPFYEAN